MESNPSPEGRAVIFVGPTLEPEAARGVLDATWRPPAAHGDVYRATRQRPWAIGLIDGYFESRLSVWHKEILYAMSQGIHVFGSASMGALRAAELETFGMVGVGAIFEAFRNRQLENDDEVTIAHGHRKASNAERSTTYPAHSEALVNMRFTLQEAERQGLLEADQTQQLLQLAQGLFYAQRSYEAVLALVKKDPDLAPCADALAPWLQTGRIDQKRRDALHMLHVMSEMERTSPGTKQVRFAFQRTTPWIDFCSRLDSSPPTQAMGHRAVPADAPLEELRLAGEAPYLEARARALQRLWGLGISDMHGLAVDGTAESNAARRREFAVSLGIDDAYAWGRQQGLSPTMLDSLLSDEERLQHLESLGRTSLPMQIRDLLRLEGRYAALTERSRRKAEALQIRGLNHPSLHDLGLQEDDVWDWYFNQHLGRPVPEDLPAYARTLDFANTLGLLRAVLREYCWQGPLATTETASHSPEASEEPP